MADLKEEEESLHTALQSLSKKLAAVSSNSKFMEPHFTEIKTLTSFIDEIASLLQKGEKEKDLQTKSNLFRELGDVFYEVDSFLQLFSRRKCHFKIGYELKAINTKLAKSLTKLQLIDLYNPEHDSTNMKLKEEEDSFFTTLQTLSIKLAVASSNSKFMEPHCVKSEIKTLTSCIEEIATLLQKREKDKDKQNMHKLFRELSVVFYEVGIILQLFPQKSCHKIAFELRAINTKLAKSLKKLQLINLSTPPSESSETYDSKEKVSDIYQKGVREYRSNMNMSVESSEEEKSFSKILQDFSANLVSISSNTKFMQASIIDKELKHISSYMEEIKSILLIDEKDNLRKSTTLHNLCQELSNIFYEIECNLQFPYQKGGSNQIANDLKESRIKMGKILKKIHSSNTNFLTEHHIAIMRISNSPVEALTVSGNSNNDTEKIIDLLLSFKENQQIEPYLIPIVQKGSTKSTEFAQNIIYDARVVNHFNRIIWVDALYLIETHKLNKLVKGKPSTLFWVHKTINKNYEEEQVLLVLDDIKKAELVEPGDRYYSVDRKWRMKTTVMIKTCESSSWFKGNSNVPTSSKLSVNEAWQMVEENSNNPGKLNPKFEEIGRNILKKFENWKMNELMIKALSRLLLSNANLDYWKLVRKSAIWKLPFYEEILLANVLELCYTCDTSRYFVGNLNCKVVGARV